MSQNCLIFREGVGSIVGAYIPIEYGDKVLSVDMTLSHNDNGWITTDNGRVVTAVYWIVNSDFDKNKLELNAMSSNVHYCNSISTNANGVRTVTINNIPYVDTKLIPKYTMEKYTFKFPLLDNGIAATQIFFAIISTPDTASGKSDNYYDLYTHSLAIGAQDGGSYYYRKSGGINAPNALQVVNGQTLDISNVKVEHLTHDNSIGTGVRPSKIECSDLRYRTYSQGSLNPSYPDNSNDGWGDGGETYDDAKENNRVVDAFTSEFDINEGRLKDVVFAQPELGCYSSKDNNGNTINEARWVFKRSRIMFRIPPVRNAKGNIQKTAIILRYKIEAAIHDTSKTRKGKPVYRNEYITKKYTLEESMKDITLVICPRDEGIKDNSEFKVILDRCYVGSNNYSEQAVYYFRTYQKPIINIAYPKIIRNSSTGNGFKYAKIPTNNIYSNFQGENIIVNKYVADTLNVLLASPKPDSSGIPLFVRFYIAEYKFGRNGCLNSDSINTVQDLYKSSDSQDYVKKENILNGSAMPTAFATRICNSDGNPILLSGRLTNKNIEDLITSETGQQLQLWTYRNWDYVIDDETDIQVRNAWPKEDFERDINGHEIRYSDSNYTTKLTYGTDEYNESLNRKIITRTRDIVGDHLGASYYKKKQDASINDTSDSAYVLEQVDGDIYKRVIEQNKSTALIFRAGYVYMIRMRMFHGAAAGAIGKKYGGTNRDDRKSIVYGYRFDSKYPNSGRYEYNSNSDYSGMYPYSEDYTGKVTFNDIPTPENILYGKEHPYKFNNMNWVGPDDGTSGQSLNSDKLNETYPGFSEVDYSIFETVCPYTSQTNLITVHPTSPQIGVNQCLSFNYRHLAKNIGAVDTYATTIDSSGNYTTNADSFGYTVNGILNTISRIAAMHTSCIDTIITAFVDKRNKINDANNKKDNESSYISIWQGKNVCPDSDTKPDILSEKITIWLRRPYDRNLKATDSTEEYIYTESYLSKCLDNDTHTETVLNIPIVNKFETINNVKSNIFDNEFYTGGEYNDKRSNVEPYIYLDTSGNEHQGSSACHAYNNFRKLIASNGRNAYYNYKHEGNTDIWPEIKIIYLSHNDSYSGTVDRKRALIEPLGNTYRWQPVINAQASNIEELKIEGTQSNICYKGNNTLDSTVTTGNRIQNTSLIYASPGSEYNIQYKYFYLDEYAMEINSGISSTNTNKRFTINEFAGITPQGVGNAESSGWPAMYTTAAVNEGAYSDSNKYIKYFSISTNVSNSYGRLFTRVPVSQDCENGEITSYNSISKAYTSQPNTGGLVIKNNDKQISIDDNFNNSIPLVRTTHYLYFKTWINTVYSMKIDVELQCYNDEYDSEGNYSKTSKSEKVNGVVTFNGNDFSLYIDDEKAPLIYFGNDKGLSEVYGEDNNGWGRCLSADDKCARRINYDGVINKKTDSGGIEVPIMARYTPLLQPQIANESIDEASGAITIINSQTRVANVQYYRSPGSKSGDCNIDLCMHEVTTWDNVTPVVTFTYEDDGYSTLEKVTGYNLNIYYPYISENNTHYTVSPNGGVYSESYYEGYYIDADSDPSKTVDTNISAVDATNLDFLGGYGICTAYSVLLVPSDPILPDKDSDEFKNYFKNTDGHWNYYKQPANYYSTSEIFNIRSKSVKDAGPVLVAYAVRPDERIDLKDITDPLKKLSIDYMDSSKEINAPATWKSKVKGRAFKTLKMDFKNLFEGKIIVNDSNNKTKTISITDFNKTFHFSDYNSTNNTTILNKTHNILKVGLTYDLVVIPIYDNTITNQYNYIDAERVSSGESKYYGAGSINGKIYGSGTPVDSTNKLMSHNNNMPGDGNKTIRLFGSNPMVSFNYLQIGSATVSNGNLSGTEGDRPSYKDNFDSYLEQCSESCNILSTDHAIIYPNVDNELYNLKTGYVKESPGFWLNNSFKLILRMPSFRTQDTKLGDYDLNTIENMSNGVLNDKNSANDFEFDDIQIHIGKISELELFGYPNNMDTDLNLLSSKEELAKAHIISYKHYWNKGVFSKRLKKWDSDNGKDGRDEVTGGALTPNDKNYANRFIEVNLSNCQIMDDNGNMVPVYSKYPEGYYIQFRWKSAYSVGTEEAQWSAWHGGSCNGGQQWWGDKGTDYYVPVRNYTDIHTEFRNYIKESYPGSLINYDDKEKIGTIGKGSNMKYGSYSTEDKQNNSTNKAFIGDNMGPKPSRYYHNGSINESNSKIVPSITYPLNVPNIVFNDNDKKKQIIEIQNTDNPYNAQYELTHDTQFKIPDNITTFNQQMWEMMYIDYIVTNMCRLYYKPKHNDIFTVTVDKLPSDTCNLPTPWENGEAKVLNYKFAGWSDLEEFFIDDEGKRQIKLGPNYNKLHESRHKWNRNKYYRKTINKQDFDALNEALEGIIEFTRDVLLAGNYVNDSTFGNSDVLLNNIDSIAFDRSKKLMIGTKLDSTYGQGIANNIQHKMMSSNYLQHIWNNILTICSTGNRITYPSTIVTDN